MLAILAFLASLIFPVFQNGLDRAKRTRARNDVSQIVAAVNAYYTDYGRYPLNSENEDIGADTVYGNPNGDFSNADLFNVLRAVPDTRYNTDNELNPQMIVFFNHPMFNDSGKSRAGVSTSAAKRGRRGSSAMPGSFLDPWGREYAVFIDADYNNEVTQGLGWFYWDEYIPGTASVRLGVAASSLGKDGEWGNDNNGQASKSDDVLSWQ